MDAPVPARLPLLKLPLLILMLVLAGLLLAAGAHASPAATLATTSSLEVLTEDEGEEDEWEGEEEATDCGIAQEEAEEGEISQLEADEVCAEEAREERRKKAAPSATAPEECVLRSAHASATTPGEGGKLKLTIGYTAYEPATAKLEIGHLGTVHRHLGRSGVLRLVENLRGDAPKQLSIRIEIGATKSAGCPFRRLVLSPR